jgi:hypothetical protein
MEVHISPDAIYAHSEDIVARVIEGEIIIVPLISGIGDTDDELYTLNDSAREIWDLLDGQRDIVAIAAELSGVYDAPLDEIKEDISGLVKELLKRRMLVEINVLKK